MNKKPTAHPSPGLNLADIYHVLFRHKGKILTIWAVGFVVALSVWFLTPVVYQSNAKLLIKYIVENKTLNPTDPTDTSIRNLDSRGDGIIATEIAILTSYDLALDVARMIGPEKILAKAGGGNDLNRAAGVVANGVKVEAPKGGTVLTVSFENEDFSIVQPVLEQLIASYTKRHVEAHLATGGLDEFWDQQTTETKTLLTETERQLQEAKGKLDVISVEESKRTQAGNIARIQTELYNLAAERAAHIATLELLTNNLAGSTDSATNTVFPSTQEIPADIQEQYDEVVMLLETLQKQLSNLLTSLTSESPHVQGVKQNIASQKKIKAELEKDYPGLKENRTTTTVLGKSLPAGNSTEAQLLAELSAVKALEARINVHTQTLAQVRKEAAALNEMESTILELERKRKLLEDKYTHFSIKREHSRFDEALGPGRISNIKSVQTPTPPFKDTGKLMKIVAGVLFGAFAGGIALAFAIELYLDRSFKRPAEVEARLRHPLFLSIPRATSNGKGAFLGMHRLPKLLGNGSDKTRNDTPSTLAASSLPGLEPAQSDELRPFFEALRDRLILSFEMRNLVHKPKLVAVTSCGQGSGVSTVAAGLAESLSKTGDGNVLLVDMNELGHGAAHYFHKGKLECGLDDALELEKRDNAMVEDNLYVVSGNTSNIAGLPRILHQRFSTLMPKLRASDYDYIIFDMPPVTQISPTPKLARFMDMVFMVVEAERSDRDAVQRATDLLDESQANVGIVLNKSRNYVPKQLQQEV